MGQISCSECGISFVVPDGWHEQRLNNGKTFWCPNGHGQCYNGGETKAQVLQRELDREKQNNAYLEEKARIQRELREAAERRGAAARGQVTKLKKRAAGGVCPCCNRSFAELAQHMKTKHPGFVAEQIAGEVNG